jgi:hypothetical protein
MMSSAEQDTLSAIAFAQSKEAKPMIKALTTIGLLLALGAVALERPTLALVNADINIGSVGAMRENIGSVGAMRERDYFQAPQPPFNADAFCRLEPALFHKTRLAQSCR